MGGEIRASSLDGFVPLVRELGGDPAALLRELGLDGETIADRDAYIPYATLARLMERTATALERPDFGLRLSRRARPIARPRNHSPPNGSVEAVSPTKSSSQQITTQPVQ